MIRPYEHSNEQRSLTFDLVHCFHLYARTGRRELTLEVLYHVTGYHRDTFSLVDIVTVVVIHATAKNLTSWMTDNNGLVCA